MFREIGLAWGAMDGNEMARALEIVETHGPAATRVDPEEWRLLSGMAIIYQQARDENGENIPRARELVESAVDLAPSRVEVRALLIAQYLVENDPQGALRLIEDYAAEAPETAHRYEPLREQAERIENAQETDG